MEVNFSTSKKVYRIVTGGLRVPCLTDRDTRQSLVTNGAESEHAHQSASARRVFTALHEERVRAEKQTACAAPTIRSDQVGSVVFRESPWIYQTARTGTLQGVSAGGNSRISGNPLGRKFSLALTPVLARACSGVIEKREFSFPSIRHKKKF